MEVKHKITVQTKHCKLFLLALSVVIATTLFSCQNKESKEQKLDNNVQTVKNTIRKDSKISIEKNDTSHSINQLPSKVNHVELKEATPIVSKEITENKTSKSDKVKKDDSSSAAKPLSSSNAEFPGGIEQFHNFFMKEYKKPEDVSYWKLNFTLAFAVEKNGSVSFLECSPAVEEPLQKEIIRVLSLCPKWQPGESNGKKTRMQYSVPIFLK